MNEAGNHTDNRAETVPAKMAEIDRLRAEASRIMCRAKNRQRVAEREGHTGWVYFISDGEAVKIGYSGRPVYRLADLQACTHKELKLLAQCTGSIGTERALHKKLADLRLRGEWFNLDNKMLGLIEYVQHGLPLSYAVSRII